EPGIFGQVHSAGNREMDAADQGERRADGLNRRAAATSSTVLSVVGMRAARSRSPDSRFCDPHKTERGTSASFGACPALLWCWSRPFPKAEILFRSFSGGLA